MSDPPGLARRNGWTLLRCTPFIETLEKLASDVERIQRDRRNAWAAHPRTKLLARIRDLIFDEIPTDPNAPAFALGNTLGPHRRHWRRAKFMRRFRLFFRFDSVTRIIVYAWVNDESTLRKAGAKTDPYAIFTRRLDAGDPPDSWADLTSDAKAAERLAHRDRDG
ncbi:MAG: type II toxin-antitoxin system YhaV family toxin [Caulobacteraceae bacterium]